MAVVTEQTTLHAAQVDRPLVDGDGTDATLEGLRGVVTVRTGRQSRASWDTNKRSEYSEQRVTVQMSRPASPPDAAPNPPHSPGVARRARTREEYRRTPQEGASKQSAVKR